ncbi:D-alanine--D-alanine ligase A [bacterium HR33]|nr:D-alanine--D-alanine ligase A [bacterium HR33]
MKVAVVFDTPYSGWEDEDFKEEVAAGVEEAEYEVAEALLAREHEVLMVGIREDLFRLPERLAAFGPELVFNLAEGFCDNPSLDYLFPALLEAYGYRYTGSPPLTLLATRNKALTKKVLAFHGVPVPRFATYRPGDPAVLPPGLDFPVIVKPVGRDASEGIAEASVVRDEASLQARVEFVHQKFDQPAIAEELVDGRELYAGILGNGDDLEILPIVELVFDKEKTRPEHRIATTKVKWDEEYRERKGIKNVFARPISKLASERIREIARVAYRALGLRDYARLDLRLTPGGEVKVIEVNANPYLSFGHDLAMAAEKAGMDYYDFIERIAAEALRRYE